MKSKLQFWGVIVFSLLYNYFFWNEKLGLNVFIFSSLLVSFLLFLNTEAQKQKAVLLMAALTLLTATMVVYHNSIISKFAHLFIGFVFVGLVHFPEVQSVVAAFGRFFLNVLTSISTIISFYDKLAKQITQKNQQLGYFFSNLKLLVLPLLGFGIFFMLFFVANPVFAQIFDSFYTTFSAQLQQLLQLISVRWVVFTLAGTYFIISLLIKTKFAENLLNNLLFSLTIVPSEEPNNRAISNEYKMALMLILSVNALLFIVNAIDIRYLWVEFGQSLSSAQNLSKLVHQGTYLLIFSTLLSMLILLYFFRKDLNFKANNDLLKIAAYVWIIQNAFLIVSVFLRNQKYITSYGLTHKRIGVAVFLLLTIIGLTTMFLKIKEIRSFFYIFKTNTWAWIVVLAGLTLIDWDSEIVRYNLKTQAKDSIDFGYLSTLSPHTYPQLYDYFQQHPDLPQDRWLSSLKIARFLHEQSRYSWLSWNYADAQTVSFFEGKVD